MSMTLTINKVRCNNCEWTGYEHDLALIEFDRNDDSEKPTAVEFKGAIKRYSKPPAEIDYKKGCPNCLTDEYLMDIDGDDLYGLYKKREINDLGLVAREDIRMRDHMVVEGWIESYDYKDKMHKRFDVPHNPIGYRKGDIRAWKAMKRENVDGENRDRIIWRVAKIVDDRYTDHVWCETLDEVLAQYN